MSSESTLKTLLVAFLTCFICSVFVATAAVTLKPLQEKNKTLFKYKNVLLAAGLMNRGERLTAAEVDRRFQEFITVQKYNFSTGELLGEGQDVSSYEERNAAKNPESSVAVSGGKFTPGLARRGKAGLVYLVRDKEGKLESVVLPVVGKGLWSTMYGFLSLSSDLNTVKMLVFYDHGETAGLGGEIENPRWQDGWKGKLAFGPGASSDIPLIHVVKGKASEKNPVEVDGISGATLTCKGVTHTIGYWLAQYHPILKTLAQKESK